MKHRSGNRALFLPSLALMVALTGSLGTSQVRAEPCDWATAKRDVDNVLTLDPRLAAEFQRAVALGKDSYDTLLSLAPEASRKAIDDCAFQTSEYLSEKGFPLLH